MALRRYACTHHTAFLYISGILITGLHTNLHEGRIDLDAGRAVSLGVNVPLDIDGGHGSVGVQHGRGRVCLKPTCVARNGRLKLVVLELGVALDVDVSGTDNGRVMVVLFLSPGTQSVCTAPAH